MKRILTLAMAVVMTAVFGAATIASASVAAKSWTGILCDKHCSAKMKGDMTKAAGHTKGCMTDEMCASSGYGVMVGGKYYKFDKNGNTLAAGWLKTTTTDKDLEVVVTGTMKGSTIKVTDLKPKS